METNFTLRSNDGYHFLWHVLWLELAHTVALCSTERRAFPPLRRRWLCPGRFCMVPVCLLCNSSLRALRTEARRRKSRQARSPIHGPSAAVLSILNVLLVHLLLLPPRMIARVLVPIPGYLEVHACLLGPTRPPPQEERHMPLGRGVRKSFFGCIGQNLQRGLGQPSCLFSSLHLFTFACFAPPARRVDGAKACNRTCAARVRNSSDNTAQFRSLRSSSMSDVDAGVSTSPLSFVR